jgi:murein DD-endopeptidase MepM/ murein hydrolase activator NlpD
MNEIPHHCKKYKRPWQNRLYVRYLPLRKRWGGILAAVGRFLKSGVTLMFIPHSERGIFKLRITMFFILSFLLVVSGALVFAITVMNAEETRSSRITSYQDSAERMDAELKVFRERAGTAWRLYTDLFAAYTRLRGALGASGGLSEVGAGSGRLTTAAALGALEMMATNFRAIAGETEAFTGLLAEMRRRLKELPCIWPLMGRDGVVTSPFGERPSPFTGIPVQHTGLDIASYWGSPIRASADGVVERVGFQGGYGLCIDIRHGYGILTRYAHLSSIRVQVGQRVSQGEFIGRMGNTGLAIGWHLHYEVLIEDKPVDPKPFLQSWF